MTRESDARLVKRLAVFASASAIFSIAVGASGLLGWWLRIQFLKTWDYGAVTMKANTSACFLLLGLSLWLQRKERRAEERSPARSVARVAAALVCVVGGLSALEYSLGWHLSIDQFLSLEFPRDPSSDAHPGLMSPVTGSIFLMLGIALIVLDWGKEHWSWPAQLLCFGGIGGSVLGFSTVLVMPGVNKLSLAFPTAVTFPVLCAGIVGARAEWALGGLATGASAGARVFRRAVPVALLVLGAIGWTISTPLLTTVHLGWIEAALLAVVCCGLLIGFIVWMAFVVERSHEEQRLETPEEGGIYIALPPAQVHGQVERRLRRNATLGFALAVLLTAIFGLLSARNAQKAAHEEAWVAHTYEVIATLATTSRHLDDVETGSRGFLLTGEKSFLAPYEEGNRSLTDDLAQLRQLTADNPGQQQRLNLLEKKIAARVDFSAAFIARRQAGSMPTVQRFEEGKALMDAARASIDEMLAEERMLLRERTERSDAARQLSNFVLMLASLLGVIFLITAGFSVRSLIDMNAQARAEMNALNADLERRVAERTAALAENEGRLAGVIQSAMDAIIAHDEQGRILVFNRAAEKVFRCAAAEAMGQTLDRFIPPRFREGHAEHIRRFAESGVTTRSIGGPSMLSALRADGEEFPMEASISQTMAAGKKLFTVVLRDIGERVRAEEKGLRLAAIVESTDSAILSKNLEGIVTSWNKGAEILYGYSKEEMIGKHISQIIPAELKGEEGEFLSQIAQGRLVHRNETLRRRKDGSLIYVSLILSPVKDVSGKIIGASSIAHDVTEQKQAGEALRESEERFRTLIEQASDAFFLHDSDGRFLEVNREACESLGYTREELLRMSVFDVEQDFGVEKAQRAWEQGESGKAYTLQGHQKRKDGSVFPVEIRLSAYYVGGKKLHLGLVRDITERKNAELALARKVNELARSNAELEQFAYVASHDLQEPLRMVATYTQMLAERYRGKLDEQAEKYIHYATDGAMRMQTMIQDLLSFSRIGRMENGFHENDLNLVVKLALENLQTAIEESGAVVKFDSLPIVKVHRNLVVQLFQNLIGNAIKFHGRETPVIDIGAEETNGEWVFAVKDNGIGIAAEHSKIIFSIFQRLHTRGEYAGNGIGLAICKKIVERHSGRIWVESSEGQGATFKFTLAAGAVTAETSANAAGAGN